MQIKESSDEETAVPAVCCGHGFLKDDIQQKEDDCQKKLVVKDKRNLSYEERLLSSEATLYSTGFMVRSDARIDHESLLLASKERVEKSSQDIEVVPVDTLLVAEGHADRGDVKEAVTRIQQQVRSTRGAFEDFFGEYFSPGYLLRFRQKVVDAEELVIKLKIDHDGKTADRSRIGKTLKRPSMQFLT